MLWIKVLVACLIVAFGVGIGWLCASKYRARSSFFAQLYDFNEKYLNELEYARKPLPVFLRTWEGKGDWKKTVDALLSERKTTLSFGYLTKEERSEFSTYLSMLGRGDALSQSGYFGAYRGALGEKKAACERESEKMNALCIKLGLLAGLAFVILII